MRSLIAAGDDRGYLRCFYADEGSDLRCRLDCDDELPSVSSVDDEGVQVAQSRSNALHQHKHQGAVTSLRFLPSGVLLLSGGLDRTLNLWTTDRPVDDCHPKGISPNCVFRVNTDHGRSIARLGLHDQGRSVLSGDADGVVKLWSIADLASKSSTAKHSWSLGSDIVMIEALDDNCQLVLTQQGQAHCIDLRINQMAHTTTIGANLTTATVHNDRLLFGDDMGHLSLAPFTAQPSVRSTFQLSESEITAIHCSDEHVTVGTSIGELNRYTFDFDLKQSFAADSEPINGIVQVDRIMWIASQQVSQFQC